MEVNLVPHTGDDLLDVGALDVVGILVEVDEIAVLGRGHERQPPESRGGCKRSHWSTADSARGAAESYQRSPRAAFSPPTRATMVSASGNQQRIRTATPGSYGCEIRQKTCRCALRTRMSVGARSSTVLMGVFVGTAVLHPRTGTQVVGCSAKRRT